MTSNGHPLGPSDIWVLDGVSWIQAEAIAGRSADHIRKRARALGFERRSQTGRRFLRGPCTTCGDITETENISDDWECPPCAEPVPPYVWGERPESLRDELFLERLASEFRTRGREADYQRPYTYLPENAGGGKPGNAAGKRHVSL